MKKTTKIITIVLSCLLLIGVMVGISVSAAEDTTIAIAKKSVSYEGAVRITYALDVKNLNGGIIKVAFSDEEMAAPKGKLDELGYDFIGGVETYYEIGGVTYPVVCSDGFAPALFTKPVYATPVVVDADGNVVAYGEAELFSIFQYCTERFSGSFTADQYELYTALLRYGASVQEALVGSPAYTQAELDKYGYADAYYVVNATVKVDGAAVATETLCYREADVTLNPAKTYNGKMFAGFADAEGKAIGAYGADKTASSWNYYDTTLEVGANNFTYNYKTAGNIQSWDSVPALTGKNLIYQQSGANVVFDTLDATKTSVYVEDGALKIFNKKWVPIIIANKNSTAGAVGKTYVFETDMKIDLDTSVSRSQERIAYFHFVTNAADGYNKHFVAFTLNWNGKSAKSDVAAIRYLDENKKENHLCYFNINEEFNLRIEYEVVTLKSDTEEAVGKVKVFINGELAATIDEAKSSVAGRSNSKFDGVHFEFNHTNIGELYATFDNTYIATE